MEKRNFKLQAKFKKMKENEVRYEEYLTEDAKVIITAFGLCSRIAKKTVDIGREAGIKLGLFRPITLWPFPYAQIEKIAARKDVRFFISVEMNAGQMVDDVRLAVKGRTPTRFYGRMGGIVPFPDEILVELQKMDTELEQVQNASVREFSDRFV